MGRERASRRSPRYSDSSDSSDSDDSDDSEKSASNRDIAKKLVSSAKKGVGTHKGWLGHLLKIGAIAAQASRNPEFKENGHFTLKVLREAHALTQPWLERVKHDLIEHGGSRSLHSDKRPKVDLDAIAGLLPFLTTLAAMAWRASRKKAKEKQSWKIEMLQDMHRLLEGRLVEAEDEIRKLERKLEGRHGRRRTTSEHRSRRDSSDNGDAYDHLEDSELRSEARRYAASSRGPAPTLRNLSRVEQLKREARDMPVHQGAERQALDPEHYDRASLAGSVHSKARSESCRSGSSRSSRMQPPLQYAPDHLETTDPGHQEPAAPYPGSETGFTEQAYQPTFSVPQAGPTTFPLPMTSDNRSQVRPLSTRGDLRDVEEGAAYSQSPMVTEFPTRANDRESSTHSVLNWLSDQPVRGSTPYDAQPNISMPKPPSVASESHFSRRTKAPTVSSVSNRTARVGPTATGIQYQLQEPQWEANPTVLGTDRDDSQSIPRMGAESIRSGGRGSQHGLTAHVENLYDDETSSARSHRSNRRAGRTRSSGEKQLHNQSARIAYDAGAMHSSDSRRAHDKSSSKSVRSMNESEAPTRPSSMMPQIHISSPASSEAGTTRSSAMQNRKPNIAHQSSQSPPPWSFANIQSPPAGVRSASRGKEHSSGRPRSSSQAPNESTVTISRSHLSAQASNIQNVSGPNQQKASDEEANVSEVDFIGYRKPQRQKKCHHTPSVAPTHCSSTTGDVL